MYACVLKLIKELRTLSLPINNGAVVSTFSCLDDCAEVKPPGIFSSTNRLFNFWNTERKKDITEEEEVLEDEKMRTLSILQSVLGSSQQTCSNKPSRKAKIIKCVGHYHAHAQSELYAFLYRSSSYSSGHICLKYSFVLSAGMSRLCIMTPAEKNMQHLRPKLRKSKKGTWMEFTTFNFHFSKKWNELTFEFLASE